MWNEPLIVANPQRIINSACVLVYFSSLFRFYDLFWSHQHKFKPQQVDVFSERGNTTAYHHQMVNRWSLQQAGSGAFILESEQSLKESKYWIYIFRVDRNMTPNEC